MEMVQIVITKVEYGFKMTAFSREKCIGSITASTLDLVLAQLKEDLKNLVPVK